MPGGTVGSGTGETTWRGIGDPDLSDEELAGIGIEELSGEDTTRWRSRLEEKVWFDCVNVVDALRGSERSRCTLDADES